MAGGAGKLFRYGCMGCVGLLALLAATAVILGGIAWFQVRSEKVAEDTRTHPLAAGTVPPETSPPSQKKTALPAPTAPEPSAPVQGPGKVILDLADGDFMIRPGKEGDPLSVDAHYDHNSHVLEESFEPGDQGWVYRLRFHRTGSGLLAMVRGLLGGSSPKVLIHLPPNVPLSLEARLTRGGTIAKLGGLDLSDAAFHLRMGGFQLHFDEPLRAPMNRLVLDGSMGGVTMSNVGNASPHSVEIRYRMGGLDADLTGAWRRDSNISLKFEMGGAQIRLPDDVRVVGLDTGRIDTGPEPEVPRPTLTFTVQAERGEIKVVH